MSKALYAVGAVVVLIIIALAMSGGDDEPTTPRPADSVQKSVYGGGSSVQTEAPRTTVPPTTQPPTTTPPPTEPLVEYADVSQGGEFGPGDKVAVSIGDQMVEGKISTGVFEHNEIVSTDLVLRDDASNALLNYKQVDDSSYGHLEEIAYPQDGYVLFYGDGVLVAKMKHEGWMNFESYKIIACEPDALPEDTEYFTIERYSTCS